MILGTSHAPLLQAGIVYYIQISEELLHCQLLQPHLGREGEGEAGGVDDSVLADQTEAHLGGLGKPGTAGRVEVRDVRDEALETLQTGDSLAGGLGLHLPEPDPQGGVEVVPGELQHGGVSSSLEL